LAPIGSPVIVVETGPGFSSRPPWHTPFRKVVVARVFYHIVG
jgi:hypothetical protein